MARKNVQTKKTQAMQNKKTPQKKETDMPTKAAGRPKRNADTDINVTKDAAEVEQPKSKKQKLEISNSFEKKSCGVVLCLGEGTFGQLGLGEDILDRKKPALVGMNLSGKRVKKVVAGGMHTVCLTDDHEVYTFGCNDEGSLGRVTSEDSMEFEPGVVGGAIEGRNVVDITAGDSHSAALTDDGQVFIWGCFRDNHGKLGLVKEWQGSIVPVKLESSNVPVKMISSGNDHIAMITTNGRVMTIGCGEQGQLGRLGRYFLNRGGRRKAEETCLKAKVVNIPKVKGRPRKPFLCAVYCGSYFTFVISTDGDVFAFGLNNYNQLGIPDEDCKHMPVHVPILSKKKWKMISGGQHHSLLLEENGDVYSIGRGEYGRLGLGKEITQANEPIKVEGLESINVVAAGPCVSFAVDRHGMGYGWGMGTNLQLTTGKEDDEWKPVPLTGKKLEERSVIMVEGGGQHTVILACDKFTQLNGLDST